MVLRISTCPNNPPPPHHIVPSFCSFFPYFGCLTVLFCISSPNSFIPSTFAYPFFAVTVTISLVDAHTLGIGTLKQDQQKEGEANQQKRPSDQHCVPLLYNTVFIDHWSWIFGILVWKGEKNQSPRENVQAIPLSVELCFLQSGLGAKSTNN